MIQWKKPGTILALGMLASFFFFAHASEIIQKTDNEELIKLYTQGLDDRKDWDPTTSLKKIGNRDAEHIERALQLLTEGKVKTTYDFYRMAMLFQHGRTTENYRKANAFAWVAATMKPGDVDLMWLTAATWDRWLMSQGKPQQYGTQYSPVPGTNTYVLKDFDDSVISDSEREKCGIEKAADIQRSYKSGPIFEKEK